MRKVIDGTIYDTEQAEALHTSYPIAGNVVTLYRTPSGDYFLHGVDGEQETCWRGEDIQAISEAESRDYLREEGASTDVLERGQVE